MSYITFYERKSGEISIGTWPKTVCEDDISENRNFRL
jgi:hypothetical protein